MTRDNPKTAPENDGFGRRCQKLSSSQPPSKTPSKTDSHASRAVFGAPWGRKRAFERPILNSDLRKIRVRLQFFPFKYHLDMRCRVARHLDTSAFLRSSNTGPSAVNLTRQHTQEFDIAVCCAEVRDGCGADGAAAQWLLSFSCNQTLISDSERTSGSLFAS